MVQSAKQIKKTPNKSKKAPNKRLLLKFKAFYEKITEKGDDRVEYEIKIDPNCKNEKIYIIAREKTPLIEEIEKLLSNEGRELLGYGDGEIVKLDTRQVECFTVDSSKVYAILEGKRLRVKERLYVIEEMLGDVFIKINQSCIANINMIKKFESSIGGAIRVVFKSGHKDYISRRQLKAVKERLGLRL